MARHVNIPVFIPHLGCPNQCVFCNQRSITGQSEFAASSVVPIIDEALETVEPDAEVEIAFFGGSFTGIDHTLMIQLLEIAHTYIEKGRVSSIRCSTRPDYIDGQILDILKSFGVGVIELGLQSMNDDVLRASKRAHTREDAIRACRMIVNAGFKLVGQMMIGLPGSTEQHEADTARVIAELGASAARIYPTVVFHATELCDMAEQGTYTPLSIDDAIRRSATALKIFRRAGVEVLRVGLCDSENLRNPEHYYAGPNHSAIGELVENEFYYEIIKEELLKAPVDSVQTVQIKCANGALSKVIGQKRKNKLRLCAEFPMLNIKFKESIDVGQHEIKLQYEERK